MFFLILFESHYVPNRNFHAVSVSINAFKTVQPFDSRGHRNRKYFFLSLEISFKSKFDFIIFFLIKKSAYFQLFDFESGTAGSQIFPLVLFRSLKLKIQLYLRDLNGAGSWEKSLHCRNENGKEEQTKNLRGLEVHNEMDEVGRTSAVYNTRNCLCCVVRATNTYLQTTLGCVLIRTYPPVSSMKKMP